MASLWRLPGVVRFYRYRALVILLFGCLLVYVINQAGIVCSNHDVDTAVEQLCEQYAAGVAIGSLCEPICKQSAFTSISCTSHHSGKELVFSANWGDQMVYVKSVESTGKRNNKSDTLPAMSEDAFRQVILDVVANKLNISITDIQLERLMHLVGLPQGQKFEKQQEQRQIYNLVQSQEYLLSVIFAEKDIFPQLYGSCGYLYVVEHLDLPDVDDYYIWSYVWSKRMKLAILIMDMLETLETDFPDPLHLCDIKMSHFGVTGLGKLKYLDLDQVHTENVLQRITAGGQVCKEDSDCDLFDCKASCNPHTRRCDQGVSNNNVQVVCEKIFVGWTMSGKLMVPGLLMTVNTPASLASLLRQCAENGRSSVPEDIRQRLYTTLTEMDQTLSDQLSLPE